MTLFARYGCVTDAVRNEQLLLSCVPQGTRGSSSCLKIKSPRANHATRVLFHGMCGVCIGILTCRGLSLVSSPLHAMKSQSQIQSFAAVKFGGVTSWEKFIGRREYGEDLRLL
ncbi:hypothetical protein Tco_1018928 [Tanacetum coccineum]|uniref:Uncharacterized protein n=1 Tax=Tanacetum coccineum TaxID=301880 RepID=A0ABQ5FX59_9ASTR